MDKYIKQLDKYIGKISKDVVNNIYIYAEEYAEINNVSFMTDEIFNTKFDEILFVLKTSEITRNKIKSNIIKPNELCYLSNDELQPEEYSDIIKRKELIELKKNNTGITDAYTCKKCKNKKCTVEERQTRSGDEPATIFITCMECGYRFTI
jgi:transcription elongation factor S-II